MKRKFILLMMLLNIIGGVKFNVLNAQETQYRIKSVSTGKYITIFNNNNSNNSGTNGGVGVADYAESNAQIFTFETNGNGYYVKSADGYYIKCYDWNVDAYSTNSPAFNATTLLGFDFDGGTFSLRKLGSSKYFKVELVNGIYYIFCDCDGTNCTIETWQLETVLVDDDIIPDAPTNLVATTIDHKSVSLTWEAGENATRYNVHVYKDGTEIENSPYSTNATTYIVEGLNAETTYTFKIQSVRGSNLSEIFSNEASAKTLEAPKTQKIIFSLKDSYGDGWNGNYFMISYEGYSEQLDLSSGSSITYEREMPQNVEVTLTYTKGTGQYTYPQENSFEIKYEDGEVIWSKTVGELLTTISYTFKVKSNDPSIESNLASLDLGTVRVGNFWTEKETLSHNVELTAKNTTIKSVAIDNSFFTADADLADAADQTSFNFNVSYDKTAEDGAKSGNIVVTYMNGEEETTYEIPMSATAYTPVQGDAIENPIAVAFDENGYYSSTPTFSDLHDDYILPSETWNEGNNPDAVYRFVLEEKALVTAGVNVGAWMAVYNEDFNGAGGPKADNAIATGLNNTVLSEGTYYLLLATNGTFTFTMTKTSVPAPTISYNSPDNESANNDNPMLEWDMQYADEYQLLFGTDAENLDVLVDWTEELANSYQTSELQDNTKYYWQIVAKNKAGTTIGEVQSFVTLLDVPQITSATSVNLYQGETATITWETVANAVSYTVYNGDVILATLETTVTSYELSDLEHNMTGYSIYVTATQEGLGESLKSEAVVVKVAGEFSLTVNVKDVNGAAIEGATVTIDMSKAYDEFGVQVASMESVTTDAEGKVIVTLPILGGYAQYGSSWLTPYYTLAVSKSPYTETSDAVSTAYNIPTSKDFTLYLPTPSSVYPENYEYLLLAGGEFILNWDAVEGATEYNVYKQGAYNYSTWTYDYTQLGTVTTNKYTATAEYDNVGSKYAVSAVFEGGLETNKAVTSEYIYVLGTGDVEGIVKDTEGEPVAGAALKLSGTTGFGEDIHIGETSADGTFTFEDVIEGTYSLTVSHYNYEPATVSSIVVDYNVETTLDDISLTPKAAIENVTVTADNSGNVSWTGEYAKYNVYRRNVEAPQELTEVATEVTTTSTTDAEWESLEAGTYQYGVAVLLEPQAQTRGDENLILEEKFETYNDDNKIPEGRYKYGEGSSGSATWKCTSNNLTIDITAIDGNMAQSKGSSQNNLRYYLVTPPIQTSDNPSTLTFNYVNPNWGSDYSELEVYWSTINNGNWQLLETYKVSTAWQYPTIDLSTAIAGVQSETIYIAFCHVDHWGHGVGIDNVKIIGEGISLVETQIVWSNEVVKQGTNTFEGTVSTDWNVADNWSNGVVPATGDEVIVNANAVISSAVNVANLTINAGSYTGNSLTVANGGALTVSGTISQQSNYQLVLEEGGQIFQNNAGVTARFRMSIDNPTDWSNLSNKDGWQFISIPMNDVSYTDFAGTYNPSTGNNTCDYDLYKYDGSQDLEWQNYKDGFSEDKFQLGVGYLASRKEVETVNLYGTLNAATSKTWGQYSINNDKDFANFRLIGNPFTFDMDMAKLNSYGTMVTGYAIVNANGEYEYKTEGTVKVGEGFFVKLATNYASLTYNHNTRSAKSESNNSINLIATGNAGKDNMIINFAGQEENGFNKIENFNSEIAEIYISNNGSRFAIMSFDQNITEIPVCFDAKQMGNYTIAAQPQGKFQSVTLIDRFTGVETNLLMDSYTFTATANDNHDRFIVKMVNSQQTTANSNFAYVSGEDLILNIEGSVQIIDVMGRVVYSNDVTSDNNRINVSDFENAAYVIRVINEEGVKVQKIIL